MSELYTLFRFATEHFKNRNKKNEARQLRICDRNPRLVSFAHICFGLVGTADNSLRTERSLSKASNCLTESLKANTNIPYYAKIFNSLGVRLKTCLTYIQVLQISESSIL
jgi:hypothetical protein